MRTETNETTCEKYVYGSVDNDDYLSSQEHADFVDHVKTYKLEIVNGIYDDNKDRIYDMTGREVMDQVLDSGVSTYDICLAMNVTLFELENWMNDSSLNGGELDKTIGMFICTAIDEIPCTYKDFVDMAGTSTCNDDEADNYAHHQESAGVEHDTNNNDVMSREQVVMVC